MGHMCRVPEYNQHTPFVNELTAVNRLQVVTPDLRRIALQTSRGG